MSYTKYILLSGKMSKPYPTSPSRSRKWHKVQLAMPYLIDGDVGQNQWEEIDYIPRVLRAGQTLAGITAKARMIMKGVVLKA